MIDLAKKVEFGEKFGHRTEKLLNEVYGLLEISNKVRHNSNYLLSAKLFDSTWQASNKSLIKRKSSQTNLS